MKKYSVVVSGGTFDYLHQGHKDYLKHLFSIAEHVLIGLTSDLYSQELKPAAHILAYIERKRELEEFLRGEGLLERAEILPIDSNIIPPEWEKRQIDAICVTEDSASGAEQINADRINRGLQQLPVDASDLTKAEDGLPITSTRIRHGEIFRDGRLTIHPGWKQVSLILPEDLRQKLKVPLGEIVDIKTKKITSAHAIAVGDVTAKLFHEHHHFPSLAVVDFIVERKVRHTSLSELGFKGNEKVFTVKNPAGRVTGELVALVDVVLSGRHSDMEIVIQVDGEEDLAVLPLALRSPLGFRLYYGQPGVGTVEVEVTEAVKEHTYLLMKNFIEEQD